MIGSEASDKLKKAVGHLEFPHIVTVDENLQVTKIEYETEWKTGGSEAVEDKNGNVIDYKTTYKDHSLTKKQIEALDSAIASIIGV